MEQEQYYITGWEVVEVVVDGRRGSEEVELMCLAPVRGWIKQMLMA